MAQQANCVLALNAGMKSPQSGHSGLANTQALWRFLHNERVKPIDLSQPLLAMARQGIEHGCDDYILGVHDWSHLNFRTHTIKRDRLCMTHDKDVGYELQSMVLLTDRDGAPFARPCKTCTRLRGCSVVAAIKDCRYRHT